jgi:hypothetical protein
MVICGLFQDVFSNPNHTTSNNMINEWEKIWKEGVAACFNVVFTHLPGSIEEKP